MDDRTRLVSIDALRGVAALTVVVFHWQYFADLSALEPLASLRGSVEREAPSFYAPLYMIYEQGWRAIDLFFVISGFIFFKLYETRVADAQVPAKRFFILRFSRLYPLHFATLLIVAALQFVFLAQVGEFFMYQTNDLQHFLRSMAFINLPEFTYNAPAWTLTVEVAMYILFWVLARAGLLRGIIGPAIVVALGGALYLFWDQMGRGVLGFFMGGLTYRAFAFITVSRYRALALRALAVTVALAWAGMVFAFYFPPSKALFTTLQADSRAFKYLLQGAIHYGLFPTTVLFVAMWEHATQGRLPPVFGMLGEISYSSYLTHFPLSLLLATLAVYGVLPVDVLFSTPMFFIYLALVILIAWTSFHRFERPAQRLLRGMLLDRPPARPRDMAW